MTKFKFMLCSLLALLLALPLQAGNGFVIQRDGQLWRDGQPYYFVGTNFWYGATLPSQKSSVTLPSQKTVRLTSSMRHPNRE